MLPCAARQLTPKIKEIKEIKGVSLSFEYFLEDLYHENRQ